MPAQWVRVHEPVAGASRGGPDGTSHGVDAYRVRIEASNAPLGSIWVFRAHDLGVPDQTETRLLAAAADQVGQALGHDRVVAERQAAEIARQGDALKSSLLQSVSHDLRTPLATIRAAAGTLRPGSGLSPEEQLESAEAIDREVEYLNRLVTNLLDLSRIEAGVLHAERDVFELDDLVGQSLERLRARLRGHRLEIDLSDDPVEVDPVFLDGAFANIVENVVKYTPSGTRVRIRSGPGNPGRVRLTVEDAGPGVPDDVLDRVFEKFFRVPEARRPSRAGTGIGLAVVRGLIEATGGTVSARRSELGGLAIDLDLPAATIPAQLAAPRPVP